MPFMVVHSKLDERVQCLLQSRLSRLVRWPCVVAHQVGPGVLHGSLSTISPGEVWMTHLPRVISVGISIKTWLGLIGINEINLLWLIQVL